MSTIITKKQFNNDNIYKTEIAGRPFSLEFGHVRRAGQRRCHGPLRRDLRAGGRHRLCPSPRRHRLLPPVRGL